mgnify:CR=1 FL=1
MTSRAIDAVDLSLGWAYAYGKPEISGDFRTEPEDFVVDEFLGFEPSGEGEHVYLQVQKRNNNTAWVVKLLARLAGVKPMDVGYCGLKDRNAVTRQWFSIYLPKGDEPNWSEINDETIEVLKVSRHNKKLRRGTHVCNHFQIRLRHLSGALASLPDRLATVKKLGVPNYFGEQRFGRGAQNLVRAEELLVDRIKVKNRQLRGLYISAARSYLFNTVLNERIKGGSWQQLLPGEVPSEAGLATGPLWGRGRPLVSEAVAELEQLQISQLQTWCDGLEHVGLDQERRQLQLLSAGFSYQLNDADLSLQFALPPGCYATAILREVCVLREACIAAELGQPKEMPESGDVV